MRSSPDEASFVSPAQAASGQTPRLESVDLLRGLAMVLMALDHTRDFFTGVPFDPLDLEQTSPALFLTRWVTHFCAPVFVFLAGAGAFLARARGKPIRELSWFLLSRGVWLVVLELTYVNWFGWSFHVNFHSFGVQVIWAIGWSMVILAGLIWLPDWAILVFACCSVAGHNAFDGIAPESLGHAGGLWRVLHAGGPVKLGENISLGVGYPLIPWGGVMAAGYVLGPILVREMTIRKRQLWILGAAVMASFILIRLINVYGDPTPWTAQKSGLFTVFSFVNCGKYPPSLCYLFMTLGPALVVLGMFNAGTPVALKFLLVFGRVPLFYYLLHLPLIHGLALLFKPAGGLGLWGVYGVWILVVAALFPVCRWFAKVKQTQKHPWLSYL